jgi:hypothetical protein
MCRPSIPRDNSAEIARQQEAARQQRITEGQGKIDQAFAGFNDQFFSKFQNDYLNYYTPQMQDQFNDANRQLTLSLASAGGLTSSAGLRRQDELQRAFQQRSSELANTAATEANRRRAEVEGARTDLLALNRSAADPSQVSAQALARAGTLQGPMDYQPLGDLFGSLVNTATQGLRLESAGYPGLGTGVFGPSTRSLGRGGSVRNVQ